jgi:hypothetical protein
MNPTPVVIMSIAAVTILGSVAIYFIFYSERLKKLLRAAQTEPLNNSLMSGEIKLAVDYRKKLSQAIADVNLNYCNQNIVLKNFPTDLKMFGKKVDISCRLFNFGHNISSEDAISEMSKEGFGPATLMELLTLGTTHPELQREFSIIALGSVWRSSRGSRQVPGLSVDELNLHYFESDWTTQYRFFGVRK